MATDMSAEPRSLNSAQPSPPRNSWAACTRVSPVTAPPTVCRSPRTRATRGCPVSRCKSLAPSAHACSIHSSTIMALHLRRHVVNDHRQLLNHRQAGECFIEHQYSIEFISNFRTSSLRGINMVVYLTIGPLNGYNYAAYAN